MGSSSLSAPRSDHVHVLRLCVPLPVFPARLRADELTPLRLRLPDGILYLLFEAVPIVFSRPQPEGHGFSEGATGPSALVLHRFQPRSQNG